MLEEIKKHYENLLGFSPRRSVLRFLDNDSWDNMCVGLGQNPNSTGIFIPRDLTARVNKDSSDYPLNLFHEYFGHGLFYEYSQIGRFLCNIERRLMEDEKARFRGKSFTLEELLDFRKENPHFRFLRNQENRHLGIYEIFAIWTERYLCDLLNIKDKFEQKYGALSKENRAELERLEEFRKSYGDLALFYEFGMPRYPTQERLLSLLPRVLGGNLGEPKLILIYGSRRAYSDIDLFIVS